MMKAQASITEYMALVFMIVLISFMAVMLIFGFQFFSTGSEQVKSIERRSLFLLQSFSASTALNNPSYQKGSVFDDSRLTGASCENLEALMGTGVYAQVKAIPDFSACEGLRSWEKRVCMEELEERAAEACTSQSYPECGVWTFCEENIAERMVYRSVPVNVFRKMNGTLELGILTVGVKAGA